ncbi:MAG: T9SS type A sorting domain-containing protein, partial [Bacteroidota bacterium]
GVECQSDSLEFQIRNAGAPMGFTADWIVIEDEMIMRTGGVQLTTNEVASVRVPANGSTYRLEINQHPDFPGPSFPSEVFEGCGQNPSGGISTGFINQFPADDELPDVAISCTQNTSEIPTATKEGYPFGYKAPHYITVDRELEYQLNFTDSSYSLPSLLVIDTLAEPLDLLRFQALAASHPYEFTILPSGALAFFLQQEPGTARRDWFVRFGIYPESDVPEGTVIENMATFYPAAGLARNTNETFHTIGSDFIEIVPDTTTAQVPANWFQVRPNLARESAVGYLYRFEDAQKEFFLYDARGQLVQELTSHAATFEIPINNLPAGAYYYRLFVDEENILQGKLIIQ